MGDRQHPSRLGWPQEDEPKRLQLRETGTKLLERSGEHRHPDHQFRRLYVAGREWLQFPCNELLLVLTATNRNPSSMLSQKKGWGFLAFSIPVLAVGMV
jgi:hypothetical protein